MAELSAPKTRQTRQHPIGVSGCRMGWWVKRGGADLSDCRPTKINPLMGSQAGLRPVAPVGAGAGAPSRLSAEQATALVAAGRLLQSKSWPGGRRRIERRGGEAYTEAVARIVAGLSDDERERLRGLVSWVRSYERAAAD